MKEYGEVLRLGEQETRGHYQSIRIKGLSEEEFWQQFYDWVPVQDEEYFLAPTIVEGKLVVVESWYYSLVDEFGMLPIQQTEVEL